MFPGVSTVAVGAHHGGFQSAWLTSLLLQVIWQAMGGQPSAQPEICSATEERDKTGSRG